MGFSSLQPAVEDFCRKGEISLWHNERLQAHYNP